MNALDDFCQLVVHLLDGLVQAVAVGALRDQDVGVFGDLRVAQDGHAPPPQVAGVHQALTLAAFFHIEAGDGAAQHVASIEKGDLDARGYRKLQVVGNRHHVVEHLHHIVLVVERLHRLHVHFATLDLAVDIASIGFLDHRRVHEHGGAQVASGAGHVDGAGKAVFDQHRQSSAVIDVGVRQDNGVDLARIETQVLVLLNRFAAAPLHQAAIQEDRSVFGAHQVFRPGNRFERRQ